MNVYDFDGTIYAGDSSIDFYIYCVRHDLKLIRYFPKQLWGVVLRRLKRINTTEMKEYFFSFLEGVNDIDKAVLLFWEFTGAMKIKPWYEQNKQKSDLVITASPDFLIIPICQRLGVQVPLCTVMDKRSGKIVGANCKGEEKRRRFMALYPDVIIDSFYSDSYADRPLAEIARRAFLVKRKDIVPWDNGRIRKNEV